jgi:hypothetical protein
LCLIGSVQHLSWLLSWTEDYSAENHFAVDVSSYEKKEEYIILITKNRKTGTNIGEPLIDYF